MYEKALKVIALFALKNSVSTRQLTNGERTKTIRKLVKELRQELREQTELSWAEINELTGRARNNRRP